ncbi:MAG TPA: IS110 family transposase [Anaerolineales bacterium]
MKNWNEHEHFAGLDWASDHHDLVIVDSAGQIVINKRFEHTAEGWKQLRETLGAYPGIPVAIETNQGIVIEQLLQAEVAIYPVNPKAAKRYRERKAPTGGKNDQFDAWSMADALRVDGHGWRELSRSDPLTEELRLLCRDELALIEQRTLFVNQLQAALRDYYPAALEAFDDWTVRGAWALLEAFPNPRALAGAGQRRWEKFLHVNKLWRPQTAEKRIEVFSRAADMVAGQAASNAKQLLALSLVKLLRTLQTQLDTYRKRIEELFAKHPDSDLFGSLPGAGSKLAPRLLGEIGQDRARFASAQSLQSHAGTAPVSFQSGQVHRVYMRRGVNRFLRNAVHQWSDHSRKDCAWAQIYYETQRKRGKSHACALRCLGQRWLKILWKMWQEKSAYNETLHAKNQTQHGSWVIQLNPA